MKTRTIILIAISAIVTLSFTFASKKEKLQETKSIFSINDALAGGLASDDK